MNSQIKRIRTGVKAFIVHEGKILVVKERLADEGGRIIHDLPGGGIELGESLREALVREVFEEVGLNVEVGSPVGGWDFILKKPDEHIHIVCLGYQCALLGDSKINTNNNPAEYEDIFEVLWLPKDQILGSKEIFINADMRKALEHVKV